MCLYVWVCLFGKEKPGHIPWGERLRLISNALSERELSLRQISLSLVSPCLHLSLLFIFSFFFSLRTTHPSSTLPCISFIWLAVSFLRIYQDFTLNWSPQPPTPYTVSLCTCPQNPWRNWNSCLLAKTDALTHDLSFTLNKIAAEILGLGAVILEN